MKKTIPITLAKVLFYIEEDAYTRLSDYLDSIKIYFSSYPDNAEIIADIENRIAEQFLENQNKNNIVTILDVEKLIISMGNVEDFNETDIPRDNSLNKKKYHNKKLFRNPDDAIIAGVASGLGAYFGIDANLIRFIFILIVFFGGSGVIIYIILWLVVPEAKTSTEKLQMRGEPITLESVNELWKEKVKEVKRNSSSLRKIINSFFSILAKIVKIFLQIFGKIIGLFLTLFLSISIFSLLFTFMAVIFNTESPYIDFPLMEIGNKILVYIGLSATFFAILIPCIFILFIGIKILNKKKILNSALAFSLLGLWCIAIITMGIISIKVMPEYKNILENNEVYQETKVDFPLSDFKEIIVQGANKVSITEDDTFKVTVNGRKRDIDELSLIVENGILEIGRKDNFRICIFCLNRTPNIEVTMPELNKISALNSSTVNAGIINSDNLSLKLSNSSRMNLILNAKNLDVKESNSSQLSIKGNAENVSFNISNSSRVDASELITKKITIKASNSSKAKIYAEENLNVDLQNSSVVIYSGNPEIEEKLINSSQLKKED